jgi:hypothetical protein
MGLKYIRLLEIVIETYQVVATSKKHRKQIGNKKKKVSVLSVIVCLTTLKKKVSGFPVPSRDVIYQILPGRE